MAGRIGRGDVRLYAFPPTDKTRPVVVVTRDSIIPHLSTVTIAPITSIIRGVSSEVILTEEDGMKAPCAINLHNIRTVPKDCLGKRTAQLSAARMNEICAAVQYALGCDSELL